MICSWIDVLTGTEPIYRKAERSLFPNKSDKYITSDQSHDWDCAHYTLYIYRVSKKTEFSGQFQQIMVISIRSNVWHFHLMFNTLNLVKLVSSWESSLEFVVSVLRIWSKIIKCNVESGMWFSYPTRLSSRQRMPPRLQFEPERSFLVIHWEDNHQTFIIEIISIMVLLALSFLLWNFCTLYALRQAQCFIVYV